MDHLGFIHDILDVKVLILYVMSLAETPVSAQTIYEFCYQDDSLSYFDVQEAIPQMVSSGHLHQQEDGLYVITEKGQAAGEITWDAIAFPVRERARMTVERYNHDRKRDQFLRSSIEKKEDGEYVVHMGLDDMHGPVMDLAVTAPSLQQARRLEKSYRTNAELVHQSVMIALLGETKLPDSEK